MTAMTGYSGITYDKNGNLKTRTRTSTNEAWAYTYDYENRLTRAVMTVSGTVKTQASYYYDALGRRVRRQVGRVR